MVLKFDTKKVVRALGDVEVGDVLVLRLWVRLKTTGQWLVGEDIVKVIE